MTDPTTAAARWLAGLQNAGSKIESGVRGVTVPPGAAAAKQKGVYIQNVTANADKWAARTAAVPLSTWQEDMITKGIPRIASGAQQAEAKMTAFLTKFLPFVAGVQRSLPPRGNLEANIARMVANARGLAQYKG